MEGVGGDCDTLAGRDNQNGEWYFWENGFIVRRLKREIKKQRKSASTEKRHLLDDIKKVEVNGLYPTMTELKKKWNSSGKFDRVRK